MTVATNDMIPTDVTRELFNLRVYSKIDRRTTACQVVAERDGETVVIRGYSMFPQTDAFVRDTAIKSFAPEAVRFELTVLTRDYPVQFHEVTAHAAPFYKDPLIVKEDLLTEALYGAVVRTFFECDGFIFAQHPDGYVGYVPADSLQPVGQERYLRWKNGSYGILRESVAVHGTSASDRLLIPPAARLILEEDGTLSLPDGRTIRIPSDQYMAVDRKYVDFAQALEGHSESFRNTPYLWGGKTQAGIDCSGFVQSLMLQEGVSLPRDASMQAYIGEVVGYLPDYEDLLPGDIVFFMNDLAHVYHVGIYIGNRNYLHSSGSQNIVRSSFDRASPTYAERYGSTFVFARRVRP